MTLPTFPYDHTDDPRQVLAGIGSFWSEVFPGPESNAVATVVSELAESIVVTRNHVENCLSVATTPILRTGLWQKITIRRSDLVVPSADPRQFGDGLRFGDPVVFGGPRSGTTGFRVGADLRNFSLIVNTPRRPTVVFVNGVDVELDITNSVIRFSSDPFGNKDLATRSSISVRGDDVLIDLWAYRPGRDDNDLSRLWGYALGIRGRSSAHYRSALETTRSALTRGTSLGDIRRVLSAWAGVPVSQGNETVVAVLRHPLRSQVVTEKNVYDISPSAATPVVGTVLFPGQPVSPSVYVENLSDRTDLSWLPGIVVSRDGLNLPLQSGLLFRNAELPVTVSTGFKGRPRVEFPLFGDKQDVSLFWESTRGAEKIPGSTILAGLIRRTPGNGDPALSDLPETVNPMRLMLSLGLGAATVIGFVLRSGRPDFSFDLLRSLIPGHVNLILIVTTAVSAEIYNQGSDYQELGLSTYVGATMATEIYNATIDMVDGPLKAWVIQ